MREEGGESQRKEREGGQQGSEEGKKEGEGGREEGGVGVS